MESELKEMLASLDRTGYCQWMKREGVPISEGFSVEDVRKLKLAPWPRIGGKGAFGHLYGMDPRLVDCHDHQCCLLRAVFLQVSIP